MLFCLVLIFAAPPLVCPYLSTGILCNLCCFCFEPLFFCTLSHLLHGEEDGVDDLHVVGYVCQELLVCTANFTHMQ